MWDILVKGGWMMIPLLGSSLIALTLVMERFWFFSRGQGQGQAERMVSLVAQEKFSDALAEAEKTPAPLTRMLAAGILSRGSTASKAMLAASIIELEKMKRGLPVLDTIITLAPLLGLLGTIIGMIDSFGVMAQVGLGQPHAVTGGVAEALICTAAGIFVAVMTLLPYNYFLARVERETAQMETFATRAEVELEKSGQGAQK